MADETKAAGAEPARKTVYVRAVPRPNFDGFFRLGQKFTSGAWTKVEATEADLDTLREVAQMLVFVDQRPGDYVDPTEATAPPDAADKAGKPQVRR